MHNSAVDFQHIRWIAFDAVDTLIKPIPSVAAIYHAAGLRHGSRLSLEQISARFRLAFARAEEEGVIACDCVTADEPWHTCESRERLRSVMDGLPELDPIELRLISSEVGYRKPGGRFFESLLARTGCRPSEILFVGDNPRTDIAAADAIGIPSLRIDRSSHERQNLVLRSLSEIVERVDRTASPEFKLS
jgi:hypothetical protein